MHGFSIVDGFVEITESLAEMTKYVANEPSVGLFYIQQHTQNAVPNLVNFRSNIVEKSRETSLHTEDLEDSLTMGRSMKECGFSLADDMIRDIRKSLLVMSSKQPKRGLIQKPTFNFQMGRTISWGAVAWGRDSVRDREDYEQNNSYFSNVFKSARQKASNLKWAPQLDSTVITSAKGDKLLPNRTPPQSVASATTSSSRQDMETDELPVSSPVADELHVEAEDEEEKEQGKEIVAIVSPSRRNLSTLAENYDDFKAEKEAKLEEWLECTNGDPGNVESASDA